MFAFKGLHALRTETSPRFVVKEDNEGETDLKGVWGRKYSAEETGGGLSAGSTVPPASRAAVCVSGLIYLKGLCGHPCPLHPQ